MVKEFPITKEVILNNKSRKGTYIYVKLQKGKPASYYKKKEGLTTEDYIDTKRHGIVSKKRGAKQKRNIETYLKRVKTKKKIEDSLGKGVAEFKIKNAERLTSYGMRLAYMNLLTNKQKNFKNPIVKDKLLAEVLSRPENVLKYKHRLEYKIEVKGQNNENLMTITSAHKGKLLREIVSDIKKNIKIGMDIETSYNSDLGFKGYNVSTENSGKVKSINIKIVFRKN